MSALQSAIAVLSVNLGPLCELTQCSFLVSICRLELDHAHSTCQSRGCCGVTGTNTPPTRCCFCHVGLLLEVSCHCCCLCCLCNLELCVPSNFLCGHAPRQETMRFSQIQLQLFHGEHSPAQPANCHCQHHLQGQHASLFNFWPLSGLSNCCTVQCALHFCHGLHGFALLSNFLSAIGLVCRVLWGGHLPALGTCASRGHAHAAHESGAWCMTTHEMSVHT